MLAAIVTQIRAHRQREAERREHERHDRRRDEREQRSVCERVAVRLRFDLAPHGGRERSVRRACERRGDRVDPIGGDVEPDLVLAGATGRSRVDRGPELDAITDDRVPVAPGNRWTIPATRTGTVAPASWRGSTPPTPPASAASLGVTRTDGSDVSVGWGERRYELRKSVSGTRTATPAGVDVRDDAPDTDPVAELPRERAREPHVRDERVPRVRAALDQPRWRHDLQADE